MISYVYPLQASPTNRDASGYAAALGAIVIIYEYYHYHYHTTTTTNNNNTNTK